MNRTNSQDQSQSQSLLPSNNSRASSSRNRRSELEAAFDSGDEDDQTSTWEESHRLSSNQSGSYNNSDGRSGGAGGGGGDDVFFDAGDAIPDHNSTTTSNSGFRDPLTSTTYTNSNVNPNRNQEGSSYDFESPSYFSSTSNNHSRPNPSSRTVVFDSNEEDENPDQSISESSRFVQQTDRESSSSPHGDEQNNLSKVRFLLGRFGRFVGMRVPGATYSTLSQEDGNGNRSANGNGRRRGVMGGGTIQDGVFANLNAKPERRRRTRAADGAEDRGEDDDLVSSLGKVAGELGKWD